MPEYADKSSYDALYEEGWQFLVVGGTHVCNALQMAFRLEKDPQKKRHFRFVSCVLLINPTDLQALKVRCLQECLIILVYERFYERLSD